MTYEDDLETAAHEELDQALALGWKQLRGLTPWGDTFEGFTPGGRAVCFERTYLWDGEPDGDIRVEVTAYESHSYETGVKLTRTIKPGTNPGA